tara:strand:- start:170 stop:433 length:264 start_codon:yes stop_codon:yes gene_type:complete
MPIIKSAKKRVKTAEKRRVRNYAVRRTLHDIQKSFYLLIKEKKKDEAAKMLPSVYKTIDLASKKRIIQANKAGRLKSKAQKNLTAIS